MKQVLQIGGALLAAATAATTVYVVATAARYGATDLNDAMSFSTIVLVVAGTLSLLIGLPAHLIFRFIGWNQLWMYALGGACIGLIGGYLMDSMQLDGAISGAIGAAAFWLIAKRTASAAG